MTPHKEILRFYTAILIRDRARRESRYRNCHLADSDASHIFSAELNDSPFLQRKLQGTKSHTIRSSLQGNLHSIWLSAAYTYMTFQSPPYWLRPVGRDVQNEVVVRKG